MTTLTIRSHSYVSDTNEEMSAAEALLRVSPSSKQINPSALHCRETTSIGSFALLESLAEQADALRTVRTRPVASSVPKDEEFSSTPISSSRINGGLDALATLAAEARSQTTTAPSDRGLGPHLVASGITAASPSSSSDDDSDSMPPPPPRRRRSASNPEGMEKWDSLSRDRSSRRHFVLPASILEEELAEASAAIQHQKQLQRQRTNCIAEVPEENCRDDDSGDSSASPDSVFQLSSPSIGDTVHEAEQPDDIDEEEVNESDLSPDELLKRARSRLLEDLSEGNMNGEKGVLTLPHSLGKYKEVSIHWFMPNLEHRSVCGKTDQLLNLTVMLSDVRNRSTTSMAELGYTLLLNAQPSLRGSTRSDNAEYGTKRFDIIVVRALPTGVCESREDS